MLTIQLPNEAVDVTNWFGDKEFAAYPEGARDKTLLNCPTPAPYIFLRDGHRYMFKRSSSRYKEQFWAEIIAYWVGVKMGISVPPTFVAYDQNKKQAGALIEWFLNRIDHQSYETYTPGGDYCQQYCPDFDRKKGKQHSFGLIEQIFDGWNKILPTFLSDWKNYWAKVFIFDALIGNTDRHQDNWGIIINPTNGEMRISPVFDNGTSLGHEIFLEKFQFYDENQLKKYIEKGQHHIKWESNDTTRISHLELIEKIIDKYPETCHIMLDCLSKVNEEQFQLILDTLVKFDIPVRLSQERADFILKLLQYRHQRLLRKLED